MPHLDPADGQIAATARALCATLFTSDDLRMTKMAESCSTAEAGGYFWSPEHRKLVHYRTLSFNRCVKALLAKS